MNSVAHLLKDDFANLSQWFFAELISLHSISPGKEAFWSFTAMKAASLDGSSFCIQGKLQRNTIFIRGELIILNQR